MVPIDTCAPVDEGGGLRYGSRMNRFIVLVGLLALGCGGKDNAAASSSAPAKASTPAVKNDLATLLAAKDVLLLDVRTPAEFAGGHVPGAVNVPLSDLARAPGVIGAKDRPVVVYCLSGGRSGRAESQLRSQGFTRLVNGGGVEGLAKKMGVKLEK